MGVIYTIANSKGGVGKTSAVLGLGGVLTAFGYKVCLVDGDASGNLTMGLGQEPYEITVGLPHIIMDMINTVSKGGRAENSEVLQRREYIMRSQNMDYIASNSELSGVEDILNSKVGRENYIKKIVNHLKCDYDFMLVDSMPSLNLMTINALNAADQIIIPVQAEYFAAKGLEELLSTVTTIQNDLNPSLSIAGVLFTMYNNHLNFNKEVVNTVSNAYGSYISIFETRIPKSVRVSESQAQGQSIFYSDPSGKVAGSYALFAKELLANG